MNNKPFDFVPKFVMFIGRHQKNEAEGALSVFGSPSAYLCYFVQSYIGLTTSYRRGKGFGFGFSPGVPYGKKSKDGKTWYWYEGDGAEYQFNSNNVVYVWAAIG